MKKEVKAIELLPNSWRTAAIILGTILVVLLVYSSIDKIQNHKEISLGKFNISNSNFNTLLNLSMGKVDLKICELNSKNCVVILKEQVKKQLEKLNAN